MTNQEINLELLLGKRVFGLNGRNIGRLEEVKAELQKGRCFVTEFHLGKYSVLDRLAALHIGRAVLRVFGAGRSGGYRVPWDQLDLSDPSRPHLRCEVAKLKPLA